MVIFWFLNLLLYLPNKKVKGNVDAELVLHTMVEYPNYDKAVIVSGDGDFYCLTEYLIKQDKLLKLIVPNKGQFSSLLRKFMHKIDFMNNLKEKLEHKKRGIDLRTKP
ncbi:MAG: NYN domain-containing protein [bacterium]